MPNDRLPRLIFASSDTSADLFYATRFDVPDPVLLLKQNGKTTLLLSDLEIDRGKKEAKVDEIVALSSLERPLKRNIHMFWGIDESGILGANSRS
jgi:Xaa-Pro aminopeptidase